jgi:type II secretory pathway component PulM
MSQFESLRASWAALSPREQGMLKVLGALLAGGVLWLGLWLPGQRAVATAETRLSRAVGISTEVGALADRAAPVATALATTGSIATAAEPALRAALEAGGVTVRAAVPQGAGLTLELSGPPGAILAALAELPARTGWAVVAFAHDATATRVTMEPGVSP